MCVLHFPPRIKNGKNSDAGIYKGRGVKKKKKNRETIHMLCQKSGTTKYNAYPPNPSTDLKWEKVQRYEIQREGGWNL